MEAPTLSAPIPAEGRQDLTFTPVRPGASPVHIATMPRLEPPPVPVQPAGLAPSASEKPPLQPRRMTREGCETPISSLAGPEARRMVPGRCMV